MTMRLFAQLTKVDAEKRLVYGRMTAQKKDKSGETLHYEKSKPYFQEWSNEFMTSTDGKSFGNVRAMHGKVAAGKLVQPIMFNDAEKAMDICAKVTDDNEWPKCLDGTYTGFSIGGGYVERWVEKTADGKDDSWYVAKPAEVSLVDNPCLDTAKFFDVIKADGVVEKVAFKDPPIEVVGSDAEVAEFAKVLNDAGKAMADAIALCKREFSQEARDKAAKEGDALPDGSFPIKNVSDLENAIHAIGRAKNPAEAKAHIKRRAKELGAEDKIPDDWGKLLRAEVLKALLGDDFDPDKVEKAKMSAANVDRLQAAHDHLAAMGADCDNDADKKSGGDLAKVADLETKLSGALADIEKLKKQPVPYVTLRAIQKAANPDADRADKLEAAAKVTFADLAKSDHIINADGTIDYVTSLFVKRQKLLESVSAS